MTRRQQKRADEIRAEVRKYIEKLEAGEIPNETKSAGIGFSSPSATTIPYNELDDVPEMPRTDEGQPPKQSSAEKDGKS